MFMGARESLSSGTIKAACYVARVLSQPDLSRPSMLMRSDISQMIRREEFSLMKQNSSSFDGIKVNWRLLTVCTMIESVGSCRA